MMYEILSLIVESDQRIDAFTGFETKSDRPADVSVRRCTRDQVDDAGYMDHGELAVKYLEDGCWAYRSSEMLCKGDYVLVSQDGRDIQYTSLNEHTCILIRFALCCFAQYHSIVSLHAACVELGDFAVAFTGRSGLGKSTRARAWVEGLGAQWISGDRPAVRLEEKGSTACGVPWDGKEQIFRDVEKPLKCIMEVRRSPANYVRRLSEDQARQLIMQQSFVPMWDTDAAVMAMANVRQLVRKTPVYRVFCGPDAEDARAICDILVNHPEMIREEAKDMKIKEGFVLRNVVDEFIVMPTGDNIAKFEGAVVLNEVSAFIFRQLENPVSREDLLAAMLNEYDVDEATAAADLDALLEKFAEMGVLEK